MRPPPTAVPATSPAATQPPPVFARYQAPIGDALRARLADRALPLYDTLRYYMGWVDEHGRPSASPEGKALRPTLCLLACEAVGGDPGRALPAAAALELVHNFSLIHDDIEDRDRTRRHRPTLWVVWGEPVAIIAGNSLLAVADLAVQGLLSRGVRPAVAAEAGRLLAARYLTMMEGQYLDISYEGRTDVTVDEYLTMIERKTGALIECSVHLGALLGANGHAEARVIEGLRAVGADLGRIFQIRDDILGIWGGPALGKPVGADIRRKKNSLPIVHIFERAAPSVRRKLAALYAREQIDEAGVAELLEAMDAAGTRRWCQDLAAARWQGALETLSSLPLSPAARRDFEELGEYLLIRES